MKKETKIKPKFKLGDIVYFIDENLIVETPITSVIDTINQSYVRYYVTLHGVEILKFEYDLFESEEACVKNFIVRSRNNTYYERDNLSNDFESYRISKTLSYED